LIRREKKDKDIWKFNLVASVFKGFDISYERRFAPKWTFDIRSVTRFISYDDNPLFTIWWNNWKRYPSRAFLSNASQDLSFQLRYYYNLDRRARLGKRAGFSGDYFGLAINNAYKYNVLNGFWNSYEISQDYEIHEFMSSLNFIYGIQRKVGKVGYVDFSVGAGVMFNNTITNYGEPKVKLNIPIKLDIGIAF